MANYPVLKPGPNQVLIIPASTHPTVIRAYNGDLLISGDASFNRATAMPLLNGEAHRMPAGVTWRVARLVGSAELRRMDLDQ